jgi:DNA polymerase-1
MEERTTSYRLVTDARELPSIAETLADAEAIGADIETTALDPRDGKTRLLQLATPEETFVIDVFAVRELSPLKEVLESGPVRHSTIPSSITSSCSPSTASRSPPYSTRC